MEAMVFMMLVVGGSLATNSLPHLHLLASHGLPSRQPALALLPCEQTRHGGIQGIACGREPWSPGLAVGGSPLRRARSVSVRLRGEGSF